MELIKAITALPRPEGAGENEQPDITPTFGYSGPKFLDGLEPPLNGASSYTKLAKDAYWTDQAVFEELWQAARGSLYDDVREEHVYPRGSTSVNHFQKWVNFEAFSAMCINTEVFQLNDWYLGSLMHRIVDGLERKTKTLKTRKWDKVLTLEYRVTVACHWLIHTGRQILRDGEKMSPSFFGYDSELWDKTKGFSKERWEFWKERLVVVGGIEKLSEGTKELVRRAGVGMEKAERAVEKEKEKKKKG